MNILVLIKIALKNVLSLNDNSKSLSAERQVLQVMVDKFFGLDLLGAGIRIDSKLRAMLIAGQLNNNTLVGHILKADDNVVGLYQVMLNEFLSRNIKNYSYINLEDDLGVTLKHNHARN